MFAPRRLDPERLPETAAFWAVEWDPAGEVRFWTEDGYLPVKTPAGSSDPRLLAYVRFLRDDCPEELQHGWPAYCRTIALPLVRSESPGRPPRPFERRSVLPWYDPIYGGVMLALQAVGLALWAVTGAPAPALLGAVAGGVYAAARWWYGRSGVPRLLVLYHGDDLRREFLLAAPHFLLAGGGVAAMIWFGNGGWPVWLWAPAGLLPVTVSTVALDRAQKRTVAAVEDRRTAAPPTPSPSGRPSTPTPSGTRRGSRSFGRVMNDSDPDAQSARVVDPSPLLPAGHRRSETVSPPGNRDSRRACGGASGGADPR